MRRKELFYYVTWGSIVARDVHWCVTVDYQQIANGNIANQIHEFTIDYSKFILISSSSLWQSSINGDEAESWKFKLADFICLYFWVAIPGFLSVMK